MVDTDLALKLSKFVETAQKMMIYCLEFFGCKKCPLADQLYRSAQILMIPKSCNHRRRGVIWSHRISESDQMFLETRGFVTDFSVVNVIIKNGIGRNDIEVRSAPGIF